MSTPKVSTKLPAKSRLGSWPVPLLWLALLALSVSIFAGWSALRLPAALLLGPMIGAIVLGVNGAKIQVPRIPFLGAQALIAAMVAKSITRSILVTFSHQYWLFCTVILGTLLGAAGIGWLISRTGLISGATAVYGTSPGAANAMVILGEAEGADARLVAFMQFSRVLLVALAAGVVCASAGNHAQGVAWSCRHLGVHGSVFLPVRTPRQKVARIRALAGDLVRHAGPRQPRAAAPGHGAHARR